MNGEWATTGEEFTSAHLPLTTLDPQYASPLL